MVVAENDVSKIGSSGQILENDADKSKTRTDSFTGAKTTKEPNSASQMQNGFNEKNQQTKTDECNVFNNSENGGKGEILKDEMRHLVEILSKLNPMAEKFVPPSLSNHHHSDNYDQNQNRNKGYLENGFGYNSTDSFVVYSNSGNASGRSYTNRRGINFSQGKRRLNGRTNMAQQNDAIKKTVYVSDIDLQVTEELLAGLFLSCGPVVDCRVCGDPNSVLRFAFVEFYSEEDAKAALNLSGTILGYYPLRVLPSRTAIAPVNPTYLPRSEDEREVCARTIYCTNIDRKVSQADVKLFFESVCGEVHCLRVFGDYHHSTRTAFVEFTVSESAIAALNCSGAVLGSLPIRVSPSKTPIRDRAPHPAVHKSPFLLDRSTANIFIHA